MASQYPAEFLGIAHEVGRIAPGYKANFVLADEQLQVYAETGNYNAVVERLMKNTLKNVPENCFEPAAV